MIFVTLYLNNVVLFRYLGPIYGSLTVGFGLHDDFHDHVRLLRLETSFVNLLYLML